MSTVGIVGLGLMGGSVARALKTLTTDRVLGYDIDEAALESALLEQVVDAPLTDQDLGACDVVIVALYPEATVKYITDKRDLFAPGALVSDLCGLKRVVTDQLEPIVKGAPFTFVGTHPMAGREKGGFGYSTADLFRGASLIVTPYPWQDRAVADRAWAFFSRLGFGRLTVADPAWHDEMIAYTSQLAHLMTVAYMLDPHAASHEGFSAGSFRDMTRVARINEDMWTELFIENRDMLCPIADALADRIRDLSRAARDGDAETLRAMLRRSRELKEQIS